MGVQMFNHRGPEFAALQGRLTEGLKKVFQTKNDLYILTTSGTGGMEAAVVNFFSPGDHILSVTIGVFGDRFASIAEKFGAKVTRVKAELGKAADPAAVRDALKTNPDVKGVLVTHNETSTGVTNDLEAIAREVKAAGKLLVVDAVSSLGSLNLPVDAWKCDVVVSGSQKGWMVPPGLAMVSVSAEAWAANAKAAMSRFYFDLGQAKQYAARNQTPWTPAISIMVALDVSLKMIEKEGIQQVFARHQRVADKTRKGLRDLGLSLLADPKNASNTVTAAKLPDGVKGEELLKVLRDEHDVVLGEGQGPLTGKIIRVGHLGWVPDEDIEGVFAALRKALPKVGFVPAGVK
jgi:aspartate aminotransferase-like enzyme